MVVIGLIEWLGWFVGWFCVLMVCFPKVGFWDLVV